MDSAGKAWRGLDWDGWDLRSVYGFWKFDIRHSTFNYRKTGSRHRPRTYRAQRQQQNSRHRYPNQSKEKTKEIRKDGRKWRMPCLACQPTCLSCPIRTSYPKITLTSSTNKRLLDEVASVPSKRLRNKISGCMSTIAVVREELINSHHPLDEAYPEGTCSRYLFPTARGGARAKGPVHPPATLRMRKLITGTFPTSLPFHPRTPSRSMPRPRTYSSPSVWTTSPSMSPTLLLSLPRRRREGTFLDPEGTREWDCRWVCRFCRIEMDLIHDTVGTDFGIV